MITTSQYQIAGAWNGVIFMLSLFSSFAGDAELPKALTQARKQKLIGLTVSSSLLMGALLTAITTDTDLPMPHLPTILLEHLGDAPQGLCVAACLTGLWMAIKVKQDRMIVELHNGRLYVQFDVSPTNGPAVSRSDLEVCCLYDLSWSL